MVGFVKMATVSEVPPGSAKEIEHDGRIIALFNANGAIVAIDGICPHQGGPLADGPLDGTCVTCPWHGWQFDVKDGSCSINSRVKQQVYEVKLEGNDVWVRIS